MIFSWMTIALLLKSKSMESSGKKRIKNKEQDMFRHVEAWQNSEQTAVGYSAQNNICKSVLYYWLKKYRISHETPSEKANRFIPLELPTASPVFQGTNPIIEVSLPGGACVKIYQPVEASFIRSIIY